jgi:GNAT superfamily N-acetyltransferase
MGKSSIEIYTEDYKEKVARLILNIQRNEFDIPISIEEQPDLDNIPGFYQTNKGNFWIALIDNNVAGTIGLLDIGSQKGALRKMFVAIEYRGKELNIAHQLLKILLGWAEENNFKEILLGTTEKFIAAHRFYEKNGFIEIDRRLLPEEFPVMKVDVKFYKYTISN